MNKLRQVVVILSTLIFANLQAFCQDECSLYSHALDTIYNLTEYSVSEKPGYNVDPVNPIITHEKGEYKPYVVYIRDELRGLDQIEVNSWIADGLEESSLKKIKFHKGNSVKISDCVIGDKQYCYSFFTDTPKVIKDVSHCPKATNTFPNNIFMASEIMYSSDNKKAVLFIRHNYGRRHRSLMHWFFLFRKENDQWIIEKMDRHLAD